MLTQLLHHLVCQRQIAIHAVAHNIIVTYAYALAEVYINSLILPNKNAVVKLHIVRLLIRFAVEIDHLILYLQCVAWHSHATLHIVLSSVHRTCNNLAVLLRSGTQIAVALVKQTSILLHLLLSRKR